MERLAEYDLINPLALFGVAAVVGIAYAFRVGLRGRVHFDRVDRQGSSFLLSKGTMEMTYWSLQPLARLLVFLNCTPNMLSWMSLGFGFLTGGFLLCGYFGYASLMATASALLDSLDGMVARMTGQASDAGELLDAAVDRYVEFFFLGGLAIYYREMPWMLIISIAALAGSFMVSYSTAKAEALGVGSKQTWTLMRRPERALYLTLGAALSSVSIHYWEPPGEFPVGYPMVLAVLMVATLANVSAIFRLREVAREIRRRESGSGKSSGGRVTTFPMEHSDDGSEDEPLDILL